MNCAFCNKECKNHNSLINHERMCKNNPNRQEHPRGAAGIIPWNKGQTKLTNKKIEEASKTLSNRYLNGELTPSFLGKRHSDTFKKLASDRINKRYEDGWQPKSGRCKKILYESVIAGLVSLDGTWELFVAKYLDKIKVKWTRNKKRFEYIDDEGKRRNYTPDFYIESWDCYLEIKGYETALDRAKWRSFPEKLIVWKKEELINLGIL